MAITWGNQIWGSRCGLRLGYEVSTNGQTTTVRIYTQTYFSISDTNNTFNVTFCGSSQYNGSKSIRTSNNSSGWNNQVELWSGSTTNQTWSISASITGIEAVGTSNTAFISGSGTAWTSIGTPGAINIKQNNDLSITISGAWPTNGINNPVRYCDLYYKWNSSTAEWNDCSKYIKIETSYNGNYSYTIPASDVLNGTHTSIAVRVYGICTYGNNTNTDIKTSTVWSSIGTPGAINIKQNSDLSITISGAWPTNGINNPVRYCELYYKWNSTDVYWKNYSKYVKIETSYNGNYSYTIPASDVLNGTHTSIAVRVYGICTYGNNTNTDIKTSTVIQGGVITKVPWRYYFSDSSNDGFTEDSSDNYIEWAKNGGEVFQVAIYQPNVGRWRSIYWGEGDIVKDSNGNDTGKRKIDLNKNESARREALSCMTNSDCGYWYYNSDNPSTQYPYPSAKYYDSTLVLESYKVVYYATNYPQYNGKYIDYISNSEKTMRIELLCPYTVPSNFKISSIEKEDFSYSSNNFNITWNPVDYANQYVIRYALESPTTKNSWYQCEEDIVVKGHDVTSHIISIPSALAGQKIRFTLKSRWHGEADGLSYNYDGPETLPPSEIQKQGGMITYINNKYQNCHVCVVDNNGKLVKALATYIYAYKDGSTTEKEWRLIKMNS